MLKEEKLSLTSINKDELFKGIIKKLTTDVDLKYEEKIYILSCAILFIKHYQKDNRYISYADFAYYIILKYSLKYQDYSPLYDFAINFGFYPIARAILDKDLLEGSLINKCFIDIRLDSFKHGNGYIETLEQSINRNIFLKDTSNEKSYLAPTSFGKSSLIIEYIEMLDGNLKIAIVVPTKSLLAQTYRMVRSAALGKKIIIHDEMYNNEDSFIAIFTQERALRLLSKKNIFFDVLFIDEAHNILKKGSRSIFLSRLLSKNRALNPKHKVVYLSPLINNVDNLKVDSNQVISSHIINFNIKEIEIYEHRLNNEVLKYNRFVNEFYPLNNGIDMFEYLKQNFQKKNFIYNYRPIKVEQLAEDLCEKLPEIPMTDKILELEQILKKEVHADFYVIKYLKHGLIYLHGKLPDLIKEYLEYKYKTLPELRYVIANSVILEGMNLPVDTLFIFNTRSLYGKELMNLIGRVNRLNDIFPSDSNGLQKLLPKIHFINNEEYSQSNSSMTNKIKLLRSRIFDDRVENPVLDSFDINKLKIQADKKDEYQKRIESIQKNEKFIHNLPNTEKDKIKIYLIESGICEYYSDIEELVEQMMIKVDNIKNNRVDSWNDMQLMEKIGYLFVNDLKSISDLEIKRLEYKETRDYYENHIRISQKKALNENINSQFKYFKEKAKSSDSKLYLGMAYGEVPYESDSYSASSKNAYVDLSTKTDEELINLAVVKLKMENDFISFKLNKFIEMMYDYEIITKDDYDLYIYGTTDGKKIGLTKYGLSISLISRLEKDGQLNNLYFDEFNNLKGNSNFDSFINSLDDFYRFEINRYLQ